MRMPVILSLTVSALVLGIAITPTAIGADKPQAKPAGQLSDKAIAARKARFEFVKKEQDKRWEFEDEMIKAEQDFAAGIRKQKHEAERTREEAVANATDSKTEQEARKKFEESEKDIHKKIDEFRKSMDVKKKAYRDSAEKEHKEFLDSLNKK